ncbi:MAG: ferric reductase-like transmembrane domain-containing protein, partial [Pseudomonadales bacterium]
MLAIILLPRGLPAAGFLWDFFNGLGFCGLAVLIALAWDSESPARNPRLRLHRNLAVVSSILISGHVLGFLVWDPTVIEYLKLRAPLYMLAGIGGYLLVVLATVSSFPTPRRVLYRGFSRFRQWHLIVSVAAILTSVWHVLGTNFVINGILHSLLFCLLVLSVPAYAYGRRRFTASLTRPAAPLSDELADRQGSTSFALCLALAAVYAGTKTLCCF